MPTFHLPDHTRSFFPFTHSNQGQALGLLCQRAGDTWAPIPYLSEQLDTVTKGWPPCIQATAAIAALVSEANKLSRHAPLTVCSPHLPRLAVTLGFPLPSPSQGTGPIFLSPRPSALILHCSPLNPASLSPTSSTTDPLLQSCSLTVDLAPNPFQHVIDQPILDPDTHTGSLMAGLKNPHPLQQDMPSSRGTFVTITGPRQLKPHRCHLTPPPNRQN